MKRSDVFPSQYMGKDDVPQPRVLHIEDVRMETIKGDSGEDDKPVMRFQEPGMKAMIVNVSNWTTIEEAYGPESDNWGGKTIELYVDPGIMFAGKRVGGLRVRIPAARNGGGWSLEEAVAAFENAGGTREGLITELKDAGKSAWNSTRDTAFVKTLISQRGLHKPITEDEIPFDCSLKV